jgi:MscS family membrane protein
MGTVRVSVAASLAIAVLAGVGVRAQPKAVATPAAQSETAKDPLGRDTPRGTVIGFITAARRGEDDAARQYLNTSLREPGAVALARKLYVVLDKRLPARLNDLSDRPEGSVPNVLRPTQDVVGTIATNNGPLKILVERVTRGGAAPVWLFAPETLEAIPGVYDEIDLISVDRHLPEFLTTPRLAGVRLFEWVALLVTIPICYRLAGRVGQFLGRATALARSKRAESAKLPNLLPGPVRLLFIALALRWLLSRLDLPLIERQFWSGMATMLVSAAVVWLLLQLNGVAERYIHRRVENSSAREMAALLRLGRRGVDVLIVAAGVLRVLHYFGLDPTAALAGLGIGGIAVALAAQKTLENVVGGLSIILDKAVRVGDFLKLGEMQGTVDYIGLRSTRIRTLDRTIVSVPNGQIANMNIETMSVRDKFWFNHVVGLQYETTAAQMNVVVEGIRNLLADHPGVDRELIRVRFIRLGAFSLDLELNAYFFASDRERFLDIQQDLLIRVMEIVEHAGTGIAFPTQTLQLADTRVEEIPRRDSTPRLPARLGPTSTPNAATPNSQ